MRPLAPGVGALLADSSGAPEFDPVRSLRVATALEARLRRPPPLVLAQQAISLALAPVLAPRPSLRSADVTSAPRPSSRAEASRRARAERHRPALPGTLVALAMAGVLLVPLREGPTAPAVAASSVAQVRTAAAPPKHELDPLLARRGPGLDLPLRARLAQAIADESRAAGLDPLLVLAVIQVESAFVESAVSPMGARGLMQLQPVTLQYVAEREGLTLSRKELDADPVLKVRLGIRYLRSLSTRFGGDLNLALMAYNAGPTRVAQALKSRELDPFRNYVRAVRREHAGLRVEHAAAQRALAVAPTAERPR